MRATILVPATVSLLAALGACTGDGGTAGPPATSTTSTTSTMSVTLSPSPGGGQCPVGEYAITTISGKAGTDVNGVPITATSGGGLTLALTDGGTWTLTGNGAAVTLEASGVSVNATVDGTAEGSYAKTGDTYAFRQERASGTVTLGTPVAGISSIPMDEVGPALAPRGTATVTCAGDRLTIASESVELTLSRTAGVTPTSNPSSPPSPSGGGTLTYTESARTETIDCAGRDVAINGSANKLTFTGKCARVSITGSRNEIGVARADAIEVTGSLNTVTWSSGEPSTSDTGTGNKLGQG
jgi:hypothetical protein